MITFLEGILDESLPSHVTINVNGVGYRAAIPLSTYDKLPAPGTRMRLLTHLEIREDAHLLFGFLGNEERDLFRLLIAHVSGVGPKLGLAVLSGMRVEDFKSSVVRGDVAGLSRISGIGKKTAERMILELRDKVGVAEAWKVEGASAGVSKAQQESNDALLALISLGYKQSEAIKAVEAVLKENPGAETEDLIRFALKRLL